MTSKTWGVVLVVGTWSLLPGGLCSFMKVMSFGGISKNWWFITTQGLQELTAQGPTRDFQSIWIRYFCAFHHKEDLIRPPLSSWIRLHLQSISLIRLIPSYSRLIAALKSATVFQTSPRNYCLIICQQASIGFRSGSCAEWMKIYKSASHWRRTQKLFMELLPCERSPSSCKRKQW